MVTKSLKEADQSFEQLLTKVGKRDRQAFVCLFEYFAPRIKSYFIKSGMDASLADELAQDVMVNVWRKASSFDSSIASAATWIFAIARNRKIDFFRSKNYPPHDSYDYFENIVSESGDEESRLENEQQREILSHAISELPEDQSSLIQKAFFEDKTHQVIAREENIPLGTVKSRIRLALSRLRDKNEVKELWE